METWSLDLPIGCWFPFPSKKCEWLLIAPCCSKHHFICFTEWSDLYSNLSFSLHAPFSNQDHVTPQRLVDANHIYIWHLFHVYWQLNFCQYFYDSYYCWSDLDCLLVTFLILGLSSITNIRRFFSRVNVQLIIWCRGLL